MQFFLYEIVARIVAAYLCFDCYRQLRNGLVERKIEYFNPGLINWILDSFLDDSLKVVHRDTAPIRYWMEIGIYATLLISCLVVAVFGWWHPDT
jgi:hypothetical protein